LYIFQLMLYIHYKKLNKKYKLMLFLLMNKSLIHMIHIFRQLIYIQLHI